MDTEPRRRSIAEDITAARVSRREMLRRLALTGLSTAGATGLVAACTARPSPAKAPLSKAPATGPTGIPATDTANLVAALAADPTVRRDGGTYLVTGNAVTVPPNKTLTFGDGSKLKLADRQLDAIDKPGQNWVVRLSSGSSFRGELDGNRGNQSNIAFNAAVVAGVAINHSGIVAFGGPTDKLSNLRVDATIRNVAGHALHFINVKDSFVRIRAKDCGASIVFSNCDNIEVDLHVDDQDNQTWNVYQHAVDFNSCTRIRGRVIIRGQRSNTTATARTARSDWFSGLTMVDCTDISFTEIDVEAAEAAAVARGLGVSLLGVRNIDVSRLRVIGFSDVGVELGGVIDGTFRHIDIDGRYARTSEKTGANTGVNIYNNAMRGDYLGRTLEYCRNVTFSGGSIRRCLTAGVTLKAARGTRWNDISFTANMTGILAKFSNEAAKDAVAPTAGTLADHRFTDCDFSFNERNGVEIYDADQFKFVDCRALNNSQSVPLRVLRIGGGIETESGGFITKTGTPKTGLVFTSCQADDTQGSSAPAFPDPNRPFRIAVDQVERYAIGQTATIRGVGDAGADLMTRINDIDRDELVLSDPIVTFAAESLKGTLAVAGTAVTGVDTTFTKDLVGRAFIKVGPNYRRISKVADDTHATIEKAFDADVPAGAEFIIVRATITTAHTQQWGYRFTADTLSPVIVGREPTGNVAGQIDDQTESGTRLTVS